MLKVIKIGGKILEQESELDPFLEAFAALRGPKILVHGGGVFAEQLAAKLGIPTQMHQGRRITSKEMLDVVSMVYGGLINQNIVAKLQKLGCDAFGCSGADGQLLKAKRRPPEPVDFGYVGDIVEVRAPLLQSLLTQGLTPIIAPLSWGDGDILNSNADTVARHIASAMQTYGDVSLHFAFELRGVLMDIKRPESVIPTLDTAGYQMLKEEGLIAKGMIAKVDEAIAAKRAGVSQVTISNPTGILRHLSGESWQGTSVQL